MRTIPSRLALIVVLAMTAPVLVVHGQQNPEAMPQAGLVRLLDEDKVAFGVTVDARADPVAPSANDDIDFVFFDMEHDPYDVSALRTWMQWLLNPAAKRPRQIPAPTSDPADARAASAVVVMMMAAATSGATGSVRKLGTSNSRNTWETCPAVENATTKGRAPHGCSAALACRCPRRSRICGTAPRFNRSGVVPGNRATPTPGRRRSTTAASRR